MPLRVAIVGSGPSGFYAAGHLLDDRARRGHELEVDVIDRLPTPWGLVRAGVAPDHPNIKAVTRVYERIAAHPRFRFFGNVELGRDVTRAELAARYDAIVYAVGAQADRRMGVPGEELPGSWPATAFVAWYNGHPDYADLRFDLSGGRAVVVGNGNVAADVARMLVLTREELAVTDVADHALEALAASAIREVVVLGRRGPAQAAFTNPELRELGELHDADVQADAAARSLDPLSAAYLASDAASATTRKNVELLQTYATRTLTGKRKRIVLRFLLSPVALLGDERVEAVRVRHNELVEQDGAIRARSTEHEEEIPASLVLRSIGYRGVPLADVPFDERSGTIPNERGRVAGRRGEYAVGWIKRGPTGIIGTNKKDAQETVELLLDDADAGRLLAPTGGGPIDALLAERRPDHVAYAGWQAIDAAERGAGEPQGRPRVKYCTWDELLAQASLAPPAAVR